MRREKLNIRNIKFMTSANNGVWGTARATGCVDGADEGESVDNKLGLNSRHGWMKSRVRQAVDAWGRTSLNFL